MTTQERRSSIRIEDFLVFEYKILTPEEYEEEKKVFFQQPSGVEKIKLKYPFLSLTFSGEKGQDNIKGSVTNQIFLGLLVSINEKLEELIRFVTEKEGKREGFLYCKKPVPVNISGVGIKFTARETIAPGTFLKIRFLLPIFPCFEINVLGKVVWSKKKEEQKCEVGVSFLDIHEDDREALIHYIFKRQRKLIRTEKQENGQF